MNYSHFIPLTNSPGDQLKIIVDYNIVDPSIDDHPINAVMEVFSLTNHSLIKTSSFPNPILANASGTVHLQPHSRQRSLRARFIDHIYRCRKGICSFGTVNFDNEARRTIDHFDIRISRQITTITQLAFQHLWLQRLSVHHSIPDTILILCSSFLRLLLLTAKRLNYLFHSCP